MERIAKEVEILDKLRQEKTKLLEELSTYRELKPDIQEAKKQLQDVKEEHTSMVESLINGVK